MKPLTSNNHFEKQMHLLVNKHSPLAFSGCAFSDSDGIYSWFVHNIVTPKLLQLGFHWLVTTGYHSGQLSNFFLFTTTLHNMKPIPLFTAHSDVTPEPIQSARKACRSLHVRAKHWKTFGHYMRHVSVSGRCCISWHYSHLSSLTTLTRWTL